MNETENGVFHTQDVVAVIRARSTGPQAQTARTAGITEHQLGRILAGRVARPHSNTLAGLSLACDLPGDMLEQVGVGLVTPEEAIRYGRDPDLGERIAAMESDLAEIKRLLGQVVRQRRG